MFKRFYVLILCFVYWGTNSYVLFSQERSTIKYTLSSLIDEAVNNRSIQIANLKVDKSKYDKNKVISSLLPNVDFSSSYSNTLKKQKLYFDTGGGASPFGRDFSDGFEVGQTHNIQAGIQVGMPIIAPQLWSALSINKSSIELSLEKARESKLSLITEVKKAYLSYLLAKESYVVFKRNYDQIEDSYKQIKQKFEKGLVAEFDVIRQETKLKSSLPSVVNYEKAMSLALAQIKILIDRPINDSIEIDGSFEEFEDVLYQYALKKHNIDSLSLWDNTTIKQLYIQKTIAEKSVTSSIMSYMPSLSIGFVYQYVFAANKFNLSQTKRWVPFSNISLQLNIPIFSSAKRLYDLKKSKASVKEINLQRQIFENKLRLSMMNQLQQLDNAVVVFTAAKDAVNTAERGYDIAKVRYSAGGSSLLELNDAELSMLQAKLNYNQSIYDFMKSLFELELLEGKEQ